MTTREDLRYGVELYPYALTAFAGLILTGVGPTILRGVTQGMGGVPGIRLVVLVFSLVLQLAGGILVFAGVFAALKRVMEDT